MGGESRRVLIWPGSRPQAESYHDGVAILREGVRARGHQPLALSAHDDQWMSNRDRLLRDRDLLAQVSLGEPIHG
jgi:hypothetical protein